MLACPDPNAFSITKSRFTYLIAFTCDWILSLSLPDILAMSMDFMLHEPSPVLAFIGSMRPLQR